MPWCKVIKNNNSSWGHGGDQVIYADNLSSNQQLGRTQAIMLNNYSFSDLYIKISKYQW